MSQHTLLTRRNGLRQVVLNRFSYAIPLSAGDGCAVLCLHPGAALLPGILEQKFQSRSLRSSLGIFTRQKKLATRITATVDGSWLDTANILGHLVYISIAIMRYRFPFTFWSQFCNVDRDPLD